MDGPERLGGVRERSRPTLPELDQVEDLDLVVEGEDVDRGVRIAAADRDKEREERLLRRLELSLLGHASGPVEGEHDVHPLARDLPEDVARRFVDVPGPRETGREERPRHVEVGDLLGTSEPGLLVDAGRPASAEGHSHVSRQALALLLEEEPGEPLDQTVRDHELAAMLGDEPAFLELPLEAALLGLPDPGLCLRFRAPLRLGSFLLETAALRLRLTALLLCLPLDPPLPSLERSGDLVGELLPLGS